jgi:hypothetical protein
MRGMIIQHWNTSSEDATTSLLIEIKIIRLHQRKTFPKDLCFGVQEFDKMAERKGWINPWFYSPRSRKLRVHLVVLFQDPQSFHHVWQVIRRWTTLDDFCCQSEESHHYEENGHKYFCWREKIHPFSFLLCDFYCWEFLETRSVFFASQLSLIYLEVIMEAAAFVQND